MLSTHLFFKILCIFKWTFLSDLRTAYRWFSKHRFIFLGWRNRISLQSHSFILRLRIWKTWKVTLNIIRLILCFLPFGIFVLFIKFTHSRSCRRWLEWRNIITYMWREVLLFLIWWWFLSRETAKISLVC